MSELRLATPPWIDAVQPDELRVTRLRALRGPNYWRLAPVIACDVTLGALESVRSSDVPGFNDRLLTALPSLHNHPCSRGAPGGFVERLELGTHIPHILEHVAIELQNLAGSDVEFGRVVASGDPGVWWVIVAYDEEDVGLRSMREAVALVRASLAGTPVDTGTTIRELQDLFERVRLGPSTWAIVEEARRRGIPVRRLNSRSLVQLGLGKNLRRIQATLTDHTSAIAIEIAQDKDDTKRVLEAIGLPVPHGAVVSSADEAVAVAQEIGFPVILKPLDLSHGRGISPRLGDESSVVAAWHRASQYSPHVIVEQFFEGRDHRVLVIGGRVVAVAERVPAHVVGDGVHTIRTLIALANEDPRRGVGHTKVLTRIACDELTVEHLARSSRTLDSVPAHGERVVLSDTANLSTGGTSIDRTDEIHPSNVTACEMAAGVVGLDIAGIDVITPDITVPFRENGAAIIEVNAAPGVRMHTHPTDGEPRNVAAPIVDMLYPAGAPTTIPVISVTGTNGKTTTVRLIAHIFRHTGRTVGTTTTDGVYLNNRLVIEGDMTGPFSANIILSNPTVDVAVLETARGGILRAGLGFDECDVAVVLNVSADHLGLRGINTLEQLADVKSVIAAVVKREGHAVLNADDPRVLAMQERSPGDVVLTSSDGDTPSAAVAEHLEQSGVAVVVERDTFVVRRGRLRIPIAGVREVPLMMGGAARFQQGNVLAAIATAYVQGIRYDDIRAGLLSFFPSPALTPGRLNLMRAGAGRLLLDYAHNAAAVAGLMDFVRGLDARRRIGVVASPGDRRDDDIRELGRLAAQFDHVIVKEDSDLRGRRPGEVAVLIREGLAAGGLPAAAVEVVPNELDAVDRAIALLEDHDLAVVLADDVVGVLEHLTGRSQPAAVP